MNQNISENKKNIIVLGGGYAGLKVAKKLSRNLKSFSAWNIILVDKGQKSAEFLTQIKHITPLQEKAILIDPSNKTVKLEKSGDLSYEFLILTLGSESNYFGIPGLEGNVYTYKTDSDDANIYHDLEKKISEQASTPNGQVFNIVIGGGGFTGAELACELAIHFHKFLKKQRIDSRKVKIHVIQAIPELIGLGRKVHELAIKRFEKLQINYHLDTPITRFENGTLSLKNNVNSQESTLKADFMIWTGGVKPNSLLKSSFENLDKSGSIKVKQTLESETYSGVYAAGDNALIIDQKTQKPIGKLGQMAIQEGEFLGKNLSRRLNGQNELEFKPVFKGFILLLGGKYAVFCKGNFVFSGILPWLMRKCIDFYYFTSVLPLKKAFHAWLRNPNIFLQND